MQLKLVEKTNAVVITRYYENDTHAVRIQWITYPDLNTGECYYGDSIYQVRDLSDEESGLKIVTEETFRSIFPESREWDIDFLRNNAAPEYIDFDTWMQSEAPCPKCKDTIYVSEPHDCIA